LQLARFSSSRFRFCKLFIRWVIQFLILTVVAIQIRFICDCDRIHEAWVNIWRNVAIHLL